MTPLETHSKNLAWIDDEIKWWADRFPKVCTLLEVFRKVLERHAPEKMYISGLTSAGVGADFIYVCRHDQTRFPCIDYTDITEGLGIPNE